MSDALPYTRETRITCLHRVRNYFAHKRVTRSRTRVVVASPAYLGLRVI